MKNNLFLLAITLLLLSCTGNNSQIAKIEVEKTVDFNTVKMGDTVTKTFTLKNTSANLLKIKQIKSSCGCTVTTLKDSLVESNSSTQIVATYITRKGVIGDIQKSIIIDANTTPNFTVLYLKGKVIENNGL